MLYNVHYNTEEIIHMPPKPKITRDMIIDATDVTGEEVNVVDR